MEQDAPRGKPPLNIPGGLGAHAWGEFASTRAEMAWKQENAEHSKEFLDQAFRLLDERMCRSWFTARRLLDAEIS